MSGINLATKFEKKLDTAFTHESFVKGKSNNDIKWNGTNSVKVYTPITQPLSDYKKTGTWRYGTPAELQNDINEYAIREDKSFAITLDAGNTQDQNEAMNAGNTFGAEFGEQVVPYFDKLAFEHWSAGAGDAKLSQTALTVDTAFKMFINARAYMVNNRVPMDIGDIFAYVPTSTYALLLQDTNRFINVDKLNEKFITKGVVGRLFTYLVVEVPDDYLPTGTQALFTHKKSVIQPTKINEFFNRGNVAGISGQLLEGRYKGDAHVLSAKKNGVVLYTTAAAKPTLNYTLDNSTGMWTKA